MSISTLRSGGRNTNTRFQPESKAPERVSKSKSEGNPRDPGDDGNLGRLYDQLFDTPALGPSRQRVFFDVYELVVERLMDAERAIEAARAEFYRGDHPFDYSVTESAATVGGQTDE
jgi:hypothetical protein